MKKVWIIFMTIISVCLSACGTKKLEDDASCIMEDGNDQSIISNQKLPNTGSMEDIDVSAQAADTIALSNKEIAVTYKGDLYIGYVVSAGDAIFLAGIAQNIVFYYIPVTSDVEGGE